jgi:hypothetical protein
MAVTLRRSTICGQRMGGGHPNSGADGKRTGDPH